VGLGKGYSMGTILVVDFVFDYFMGSISKSMVVDILANNASISVEGALYVVYKLGF